MEIIKVHVFCALFLLYIKIYGILIDSTITLHTLGYFIIYICFTANYCIMDIELVLSKLWEEAL